MQLLITYVPGISQPDIGGNPLASAALGGHIPALQFLLQHGAHPQNMRGTPFSSEHAFCPLRDAILHRARSPEVIQFMVDQGICWEGWSKALAAACTCGDAQLVQLLLSKAWEEPPPPGHPAGHIWCNLYSAARHRNTSVMRVLLEAGMHPANIAAAFCESAARGNVEGLALLHQYGAQIDCVDRSSRYARTALQSALSCKRTAAVQWLLQKKATVTTSALCAAVLRGAPSQVKLLMSHGACDPDSRAIAIAAQMGLADMVQVLLDARLSAAPHQAAAAAAVEVPMCAAASCGQVKMVRSLLNYLSAASATAASQRVTGPGAADRGSTRGHSAGNQASSSCSSSTSTPSVPQVLHRAMEAAAAGQRYCLVHSHLEQYDDRKQCQHGCQWREVARGFQQLSNHGESDDDDYDEDDDRPPRQPRKEFQKVTELLIAAGADPTYDGCRFLLRAIEVNNTTMIDTLLPLCAQHPAVVSGAALHWAIQAGSLHGVLQLRALKKTGQ
jgi:ankyrin repeat protein